MRLCARTSAEEHRTDVPALSHPLISDKLLLGERRASATIRDGRAGLLGRQRGASETRCYLGADQLEENSESQELIRGYTRRGHAATR